MNEQLHPKFAISNFTIKRVDDNYVLIGREKPVWIAANQLGLNVLQLCNGRNTASDIAATLSNRYSVAYETVYKDTVSLIDTFQNFIQNNKASNIEDLSSPLYIELAKHCNLDCIHCCVDKNKSVKDRLQLNEYFKVIEEYHSLPNHAKRIILFGGEPLLNRNWLEITKFAEDLGFDMVLSTNGTLITREIAEKMASTNIRLQVSLDGASQKIHDSIRGSGAFESTIRGITNLKKAGINNKDNNAANSRFWFSFTPMKINLDEAKDFVELALSLGVYWLHFPHIIKLGNAERNWSMLSYSPEERIQFEESLQEVKSQYPSVQYTGTMSDMTLHILAGKEKVRNISCRSPWYIDVEGNIFWCSDAVSDEYCLGNIRTFRLAEIPGQDRYQNMLGQFEEAVENKHQLCASCEWNAFCFPSCPMRTLARYGTMSVDYDFCEQLKYWFNKSLEKLVREEYEGAFFNTVFDQCY